MKTSVIEVRDLLSVLTVDEVEKRLVEVPGVETATVNYAARNATVRYDETLLEVADIKVIVHQRGPPSADESRPKHASEQKPEHVHGIEPVPEAASNAAQSTPAAPVPKSSPDAAPLAPDAGPAAP